MAASSRRSRTKQVLLVRAKTFFSFPRHSFPICTETLQRAFEGSVAEYSLQSCQYLVIEINFELV